MKGILYFVVVGICIAHALEGFVPIFSVVDEATKSISSIATDEHSNIAILGSFNGAIELGGSKFTSAEQDIFIAKLNSNHSVLWSHQIGGLNPEDPSVIKFDHQNNIIFGGKFGSESITFQHATLTRTNEDPTKSAFDILLSKFAPNGSLYWMKSFGDANSSSQHLTDLEILSDNCIVTCGVYYSVGYFGGDRFYARSHPKARYNMADFFVAKYTPNGDHVWSIGLGGDREDTPGGMALDKFDNIYVTATFSSDDFMLDGTLLPEPQGRDGLVIKFTSNGTCEWYKNFGSRGTDLLRSIAVDSNGDIIVAGEVAGNVTIDDTLLPAHGYQQLMLLKISRNGTYLWGHLFSAVYVTPKQTMINFRTDHIIVLGNYNSENFSLGLDFLPYSPEDCLFVAEWSPSGDTLFSKGLCGNRTLHAESGTIDANTGAILVGCDLYDISVLGKREMDSEKSEMAILMQVLPAVSQLQYVDIHDEL